MRKHAFLIAFALVLLLACGSQSGAQSEEQSDATGGTEMANDDQKTLYAIGLLVAQQLGGFDLQEGELQHVLDGISDGITGADPKVDLQVYGPKVQQMAQTRSTEKAAREKVESATFLEGAAGEDGAETTDSGLVYTEITPGTGGQPAATDTVKVHYHGTLRDGTVFDSSVDRGEPAQFALNRVIPCWTEGVGKMQVGGKSKLVCPPDIAYGDQGRPGIPGGAALVFEVELIEIVEAAAAAPAPGAGG